MEVTTTTAFVRPVFKPKYRVVPQLDGLVLLSEGMPFILAEPHYGSVARLLDGRTVDEIAANLPEGLTAEQFYDTLAELEKSKVLEEAPAEDGGIDAQDAAWWSGQNTSASDAHARLARTTVALDTLGDVDAKGFAQALQTANVQVQPNAALRILLVDDYQHPDLAAYNEERLDDETPWLLVKPVGAELWMGPLVRPWDTACWECMAQRLRLNQPVETFLQKRTALARPDADPFLVAAPRAQTAATQQTALHLAALQIADWIARDDTTAFENALVTINLRSLQKQRHGIVQRPQCPACGVALDGEEQPAHPVVLESQQKHFTHDGGHRTVAPDVTVKRYEHHVSRLTGAVNQLKRGKTADKGLYFYQAGRNTAFHWFSLKDLQGRIRSQSSGKGATDIQARASAICETLERYSAVWRGDEPFTRAVMKDLGDRAIHPNDCMHYSEAQFAAREDWNSRDSKFNRVPMRFDPDMEIAWSPVWSLTHQEHRYLPTAFTYFGYHFPKGTPLFVHACSNGNAAGNTIEEAILQGFFELVERDSVGLWWYPRIQKPAVDLDSFDDPYINKMRTYLAENGRSLWVLNLTTDLGIPAFVCCSAMEETGSQLLMGFGAHLDARIAVLRAVTEMVQLSARFLDFGVDIYQPKPEEKADGHASEVDRWMTTANLENQPYFVPDPNTPLATASDFGKLWTDDIRDDVLYCQSVVEKQGYEMLVVDQTRPDIKLPCVKVIVPGLRHFWSRFAPGRLYDTPVKMGWLDAPVAEEDMNPIPMFL